MLSQLPGINTIRNGQNRGFLRSCNRAALVASGQYILFLNNDTELDDGALRALLERIASDNTIGIVGSKLIYPDGRLQEAGGIIFSDASGWNYGRFDAPQKYEYMFCRDVDYVSGASLLLPTKLFHSLGGFDDRYAPAYYEDADLCFAVRASGKRVVFEPRSVVTHYEGISSGTDLSSGTKRYQEINKPTFLAKWAKVLTEEHSPPDAAVVPVAARRRGSTRRTILVIDSYVPLHDREAGSNRLKHLVDGFIENEYRVVFFPDNGVAMEPYTSELQRCGVEVVYKHHSDARDPKSLFLEALKVADIVWLCRPELCLRYVPLIRSHSEVPILYDTIDLHHLRMKRQAEHEGNGDDTEWIRMQELELTCALATDATVVVTEAEATVLRTFDIDPIAVVPTIHDVEPIRTMGYEATSGLIFIGGYSHTPNVDAAKWLVDEIMPLVWERMPEMTLVLLGSNPPASVRQLASERVAVPGYLADVGDYFRLARLFVAPLRYGAGVNGKIGQALGFALPIVTTPVGAKGFGLMHRSTAMVVEGSRSFADAIITLYGDQALWTKISAASSGPLEPFRPRNVVGAALTMINHLLDI